MEKFSARDAFKEIRNFLAGRFLGATRDEFFLDELVKLIFCKYELKDVDTFLTTEIELSSVYRKAFRSVVEMYPDIYDNPDVEIELDPVSIKYIDERLSSLDILNLGRDIIGDAYEIFIGDSIKGQSGQFFTPQNAAKALVDMIQPSPDSKILDLACGAGGFLIAVLKYWMSQGTQYQPGHLFGVDKDAYLTRLCKIHLSCMGYNTNNIVCADSLVWNTDILGNDQNEYDFILTNPPFGVNIQAGSAETLSKFSLAYKYKADRSGINFRKSYEINHAVAPQVVFMEQCIRLVKPGGLIGIVIPESMISNKKYLYVIQYILETCRVHAVIGMPEALFKTSGKGGTHTKTCLLVLQKSEQELQQGYDMFMAEAKWCGHDSRGREIPNDDIPDIVQNYLDFQNGKLSEQSDLGFITPSEAIKGVLTPRAYAFADNTYGELSKEFYMVTIGQLIEEGVLSVATGNELGKLAYGTGTIPFVRTSDISNWEIKSDPKHLVSHEIYDSLAEKQDVQEGDILMVKDGSYLIGTCAMITKYDTKIIYQSHLYKIRVNEKNTYGLDRYYLLASLSSDFLRQQIAANTYSHDIINSLGDRLKDLTIPISRNEEKRRHISNMVQQSITGSIEARELAKQARAAVLAS